MARKKKDRLMAFEILSPDTLHPHTERVCRNFVCYESDVRTLLDVEIRNDKQYLKTDETTKHEFDIIAGRQTELREGLGNLGIDMVSLVPISLEKSVKTTTPYIYRVRCYGESKLADSYGTRKEALSYIQKKIKTRRVVMHHNGITEKCDFDINHIDEVFNDLEEDTIEFDISQIGRGNTEGDTILVTVFKNDMK